MPVRKQERRWTSSSGVQWRPRGAEKCKEKESGLVKSERRYMIANLQDLWYILHIYKFMSSTSLETHLLLTQMHKHCDVYLIGYWTITFDMMYSNILLFSIHSFCLFPIAYHPTYISVLSLISLQFCLPFISVSSYSKTFYHVSDIACLDCILSSCYIALWSKAPICLFSLLFCYFFLILHIVLACIHAGEHCLIF